MLSKQKISGWTAPHLTAEDARNVSAVRGKGSLLCNQWDTLGRKLLRGFMNLIRKFYLDLTPLWCPSVVSTIRGEVEEVLCDPYGLRLEAAFTLSCTRSWSSAALVACRSAAFREPLMWWMNEGHRAALWARLCFSSVTTLPIQTWTGKDKQEEGQ